MGILESGSLPAGWTRKPDIVLDDTDDFTWRRLAGVRESEDEFSRFVPLWLRREIEKNNEVVRMLAVALASATIRLAKEDRRLVLQRIIQKANRAGVVGVGALAFEDAVERKYPDAISRNIALSRFTPVFAGVADSTENQELGSRFKQVITGILNDPNSEINRHTQRLEIREAIIRWQQYVDTREKVWVKSR